MVFGRKACFPNVLNGFWETVSGDRPLPRGAPGRPIGMYWFYKRFQHSGRALRGASHGPAICCVMLRITKRFSCVIRVPRYAKQALGPMDGSGRRGSPRTSTSLIEESGTRRSPKTSTRSDEGIREATDLRGQALGLMKESGGRGSPRTNTRSDAGIWEGSLSKDKH